MNCRLLLILVIFMGLVSACGGSSKEGPNYNCEEALADILSTEKSKICDPVLFENFEMNVIALRNDCSASINEAQRAKINKKLAEATKCAEVAGISAGKRHACAERADGLAGEKECTGQDCANALNDIKQVIDDCKDPALDGPYMKRAKDLAAFLEQRIRDRYAIDEFTWIKTECERYGRNSKKRRAQNTFNGVIKVLAQSDTITETQTNNSAQVEAIKKEGIIACDATLRQSINWLAQNIRDEIKKKKAKKGSKRLKRRLKRVTQLRERVLELELQKIFKEVTAPFDELLKENNIPLTDPPVKKKKTKKPEKEETPSDNAKDKASDESEETIEVILPDEDQDKDKDKDQGSTETPKEDVVSISVGDEAPTSAKADRAFLRKSKKSCKKQTKNKKQFEAKIRAYTKKGNKNKVNAYGKKLEKTNKKLSELEEQINQVSQKTKLPPDELKALLEQLQKAGCSVN